MRYEVRLGASLLMSYPTMAEALSTVRRRITGMAPYAAAMSELAIVKCDARGRARRAVSGRDLVALALGAPRSELFPTERGWAALDDAVAAGSPLDLQVVPEGSWHEQDRWSLVARIGPSDGAPRPPESVVLWVARSRREIEDAMSAARSRVSSHSASEDQ